MSVSDTPTRTSAWRRRPVALAGFALGAFALAPLALACGDDDGGDVLPDDLDGTDSTPTMVATTPAGDPTTPGGRDGGDDEDDGDAAIPTNAQDYAMAVFEAWEAGDEEMLDELAADEAVQVLESEPFDPTMNWAAVGCNAGAGSVACTWQSASGETLEILVDNAMAAAGETDAAVEARFS